MTNTFETEIVHHHEAQHQSGPDMRHILPEPQDFFQRLTAIHDGLPPDMQEIAEISDDSEVHITLTRVNGNGITIRRVTTRHTGAGAFITREAAIVIQGETPREVFYGFRLRSGLAENIEESNVVECDNAPYSRDQIGLLITTTEKAYKRNFGLTPTSPNHRGTVIELEPTVSRPNHFSQANGDTIATNDQRF